MKKIALILAMLLCLVPVLSACGGLLSSPKSVASNAFEAMFIDQDYEAFFETSYIYNMELLETVMGTDSDFEDYKDSMRERRDSLKETIKDFDEDIKEEFEVEEYEIKYDVRYTQTYKKDSKYYDEFMENFYFSNTDYEELVEAVAIVGIAAEVHGVNEDGEKIVSGMYRNISCCKINGKWYISYMY